MEIREVYKFEIFQSYSKNNIEKSVNNLYSRDDIRIIALNYKIAFDKDNRLLHSVDVTYAYNEPV